MTKLHQVVGAILQNIVRAGVVSDAYSRDLIHVYGADPILKQISVPHARIKEITLDLKLALTDTEQQNNEANFTAGLIVNTFVAAIRSANTHSSWQLVTGGIFTPEFNTALMNQFDKNLRAELAIPAGEIANVESQWDEISRLFDTTLETRLQFILQEVGQEALTFLVARIREATSAEFLLARLSIEVEQNLLNDEELGSLADTLLTLIQSTTFTNSFQEQINQLLNIDNPANTTTLFNSNFELETEALTENLRATLFELLLDALVASEEIAAHIEEQGLDPEQIAQNVAEMSLVIFDSALHSLANELRVEVIVQRYLTTLEARLGEELMEHVQAAASAPAFLLAFQEQCLQFIFTETFQHESVEEYQRAVTIMLLTQLSEHDQEFEAFTALLNDGADVAEIRELALQMLKDNSASKRSLEDHYNLNVEVSSKRLQQLPEEAISSLQITIALDDDIWPTAVANT